jgi:hypothetical protein
MVWYWLANEAERHFDFLPSRYCKSSQTSSRTWMLSENVLPLTRNLDLREVVEIDHRGRLLTVDVLHHAVRGDDEQRIGICRRPAQKAAHPASLLGEDPPGRWGPALARLIQNCVCGSSTPAPRSRLPAIPRSSRILIIADRLHADFDEDAHPRHHARSQLRTLIAVIEDVAAAG